MSINVVTSDNDKHFIFAHGYPGLEFITEVEKSTTAPQVVKFIETEDRLRSSTNVNFKSVSSILASGNRIINGNDFIFMQGLLIAALGRYHINTLNGVAVGNGEQQILLGEHKTFSATVYEKMPALIEDLTLSLQGEDVLIDHKRINAGYIEVITLSERVIRFYPVKMGTGLTLFLVVYGSYTGSVAPISKFTTLNGTNAAIVYTGGLLHAGSSLHILNDVFETADEGEVVEQKSPMALHA